VVNFEEQPEELETFVGELAELRRIAALNIVRAADILDRHDDEEVSKMLIHEAAVMLTVVSKVEYLLGVDPPANSDVNL
jgi:hypothetical protein